MPKSVITGGAPLGGRGALTLDDRSQSRALRLSLVLFLLLLPLAALGFAVATSIPQAQLADSIQTISDTWTRLLSNAPWHSASRQLPVANAVRAVAPDISSAPLSIPKGAERGLIAYGDRLKITFFESLGVPVDSSGATSDHVVATVFPRMDLSAEYTVDDGGTVNIPKLGQFATTGRTISVLQSELATGFKHTIGRTSDVHVAIVERQPIYVLGTVRNAGTFKHTPGMIVLQALADAGGIELGMGDTSRAIEGIRETERVRQAEDRRDRLLVKRAELIAQRENADAIVVPASIKSRLSETTPHDGLNALIAGATATLNVERRSYQQQLSLAERQVGIARTEIEAQNMRADQLKTLLATKMTRLRELQEIAARGSVSQYKLTDVNVDISELVARQQDLHVMLAQAERRLVEAAIAQAKIELDHTVGIEKELATTEQDIDDSTQTIASMQAVTRVLRNGLPEAAGAASIPGISIMRRAAEGFTVIRATETTSLVPGDVIQVNSANRSGGPTAENAQDTQRPQLN
jgi:polysaccharide biosynthesis/export protein ExoF